MKDKEMAKEYAVQFGFGSDCNNITSHNANEAIAQAFFVGLREGRREKWHDLRKDPDDLPKIGVQVLSEKGTLVIYKGVGFNWVEYSPNADNIKLRKWEEPIAWCEIPTFDEE